MNSTNPSSCPLSFSVKSAPILPPSTLQYREPIEKPKKELLEPTTVGMNIFKDLKDFVKRSKPTFSHSFFDSQVPKHPVEKTQFSADLPPYIRAVPIGHKGAVSDEDINYKLPHSKIDELDICLFTPASDKCSFCFTQGTFFFNFSSASPASSKRKSNLSHFPEMTMVQCMGCLQEGPCTAESSTKRMEILPTKHRAVTLHKVCLFNAARLKHMFNPQHSTVVYVYSNRLFFLCDACENNLDNKARCQTCAQLGGNRGRLMEISTSVQASEKHLFHPICLTLEIQALKRRDDNSLSEILNAIQARGSECFLCHQAQGRTFVCSHQECKSNSLAKNQEKISAHAVCLLKGRYQLLIYFEGHSWQQTSSLVRSSGVDRQIGFLCDRSGHCFPDIPNRRFLDAFSRLVEMFSMDSPKPQVGELIWQYDFAYFFQSIEQTQIPFVENILMQRGLQLMACLLKQKKDGITYMSRDAYLYFTQGLKSEEESGKLPIIDSSFLFPGDDEEVEIKEVYELRVKDGDTSMADSSDRQSSAANLQGQPSVVKKKEKCVFRRLEENCSFNEAVAHKIDLDVKNLIEEAVRSTQLCGSIFLVDDHLESLVDASIVINLFLEASNMIRDITKKPAPGNQAANEEQQQISETSRLLSKEKKIDLREQVMSLKQMMISLELNNTVTFQAFDMFSKSSFVHSMPKVDPSRSSDIHQIRPMTSSKQKPKTPTSYYPQPRPRPARSPSPSRFSSETFASRDPPSTPSPIPIVPKRSVKKAQPQKKPSKSKSPSGLSQGSKQSKLPFTISETSSSRGSPVKHGNEKDMVMTPPPAQKRQRTAQTQQAQSERAKSRAGRKKKSSQRPPTFK